MTTVSKLKERVSSSPTQLNVSKLRQRTPTYRDQPGVAPARTMYSYTRFQDDVKRYNKAFDRYEQERQDFINIMTDWGSKEERRKERKEFKMASKRLTRVSSKLQESTQMAFGYKNIGLESLGKDLSKEKQELTSAEKKTGKIIRGYNIQAKESLEGFSYYEGLGFAKGNFKQSDYAVSGGDGSLGMFYPEGEYQLYDPMTGTVKTLQANPQSTMKEIVALRGANEISLTELDEKKIKKGRNNPVIGQQFNYNKYRNNPSYKIIMNNKGSITEIRHKDKKYVMYEKDGEKKYGKYSPEVIYVNDGKVTAWEKYKPYRKSYNRQFGQQSFDVMTTQTILYDKDGLIRKKVQWQDKARDSSNSSSITFPVLEESYNSGVMTGRTTRYYNKGKTTKRIENYLTGKAQVIGVTGKPTQYDTMKVNLPTGEALQNIKKYVVLPGVKLKEKIKTASPGEAIRKKSVSFTDIYGKTKTSFQPMFNPPTMKGKKDVLFGSPQGATRVLSKLPYQGRKSDKALQKSLKKQLDEYSFKVNQKLSSQSVIIGHNPFTSKSFIMTKPSKLKM